LRDEINEIRQRKREMGAAPSAALGSGAVLPYQAAFLQLCLDMAVLRFGSFTLKSGRVSPYFFNAGLFSSGSAMHKLGSFYAEAICRAGIEFDVLFGPAYKGIPLATAVATCLSTNHGRDVDIAYNRKEAKDHGEGGSLVGAPVQVSPTAIVDVACRPLVLIETNDKQRQNRVVACW
jgi:orotate phosphoribosyltransferase